MIPYAPSLEVAGDDIEVERRMVGYDLEAFLFCTAEEAGLLHTRRTCCTLVSICTARVIVSTVS